MKPTIDLDELKKEVLTHRGYWHPFHEGLLDLSPQFLEAYLQFQSAPWQSKHLAPKVREFIYIAVDGSVAHLYESGARRHIEQALKLGATKEEVIQVILLATCESAHQTHTTAMPILVEELNAAGEDTADLNNDERRIKEQFVAIVGTWPDGADALMKIAPDFIDGFLSYRSIAWAAGPLEPKVREFIGLAVSASPALLDAKGIRAHIRRALQLEATKEEISEVLQLASAISIHTCTICVPALVAAINADAEL